MAEVEEWREKFLLRAENALCSRPRDEKALKDEQIKRMGDGRYIGVTTGTIRFVGSQDEFA